jgi:uncharacterized protein (DUF302 family)
MARLIAACFLLLCSLGAAAQEGVLSMESPYSVEETANRLEQAIRAEGMTLFDRIDHSAEAAKVNMELPPTQLFIFGNPQVGTELMECRQSVALELPMKMLVTEENGVVSVLYNDPHYVAERYEIEGCDRIVTKIANALNGLAEKAVETPVGAPGPAAPATP